MGLRLLQCGYSFLPAKEIPDNMSGSIHNFFSGGGGGGRQNQWLNEPITPFSLFQPFAFFLAPQNQDQKLNIVSRNVAFKIKSLFGFFWTILYIMCMYQMVSKQNYTPMYITLKYNQYINVIYLGYTMKILYLISPQIRITIYTHYASTLKL